MRRHIQSGDRNAAPLTACRMRLAAVAVVLAFCGTAWAQGPGGRPGGGPGGPGMSGPGIGGPGFHGGTGGRSGMPGDRGPGGPPPGSGGNQPGGATRSPLQQGPGGRWWDEGKYARTVGLTNDQQRRMDGIFAESRGSLVSSLDNLRKAQSRLDTVSKSDHPSEAAVLTEIQNVAQARADLEKANTHMLLQLRNEMTQDQINKLEKLK